MVFCGVVIISYTGTVVELLTFRLTDRFFLICLDIRITFTCLFSMIVIVSILIF